MNTRLRKRICEASTALHEKIPAQRTDSMPAQEFPRAPCSYSHFGSGLLLRSTPPHPWGRPLPRSCVHG